MRVMDKKPTPAFLCYFKVRTLSSFYEIITMNQSILITGGNAQERYAKSCELAAEFLQFKPVEAELKTHPDYVEIIPELATGIGIGQIRELIRTLLLKPLKAPYRLAVIPSAELLTTEAQNAFLKTLEEPPERVIIILCTRDPQLILPTLVSRCRLIKLSPKAEIELTETEFKELSELVTKLFQTGVGQKFSWTEKYAQSREEALLFVDKLTIVTHGLMITTIEKKSDLNVGNLKNLLLKLRKTKIYIQANVNPRFVLENLFLSC